MKKKWRTALSGLILLVAPAVHAQAPIRIYDIQGRGAVSPLSNRHVARVPGVVTFLTDHGFYLQDPEGDGDPATSDGIFVYTHDRPRVHAGEHVRVNGIVREYRPGGRNSGNLTITEVHAGRVRAAPGVFRGETVTATLIGRNGRLPPTRRIAGPVPGRDGTAFYESLEGMRVKLARPQVVGPANRYGEAWAVADGGAGATGMNARGGITLRRGHTHTDWNPERIRLRFPRGHGRRYRLNTGTRVQDVQGVMSYSYGNYVLLAKGPPRVLSAPLRPEVGAIKPAAHALTVATYKVENLAPGKHARMRALARQIVAALHSPDILALQEIQDDSGGTDDGQTHAAHNLHHLEQAIERAGGPVYRAVEIDPQNDRDGGEPGGNIRQVLLYNPHCVALAPSPLGPGDATTATHVLRHHGRLSLSLNPGRVDPRAGAFSDSRKPLAAAFDFQGRRLIVVDNHLAAKAGSTALYGARQPPVNGGEKQRIEQARLLRHFAARVLQADRGARLIVLGDFNDFGFMPPLRILTRRGSARLYDLVGTLAPTARYTYIYQGNAQALDHVLVSPTLNHAASVDIVHLNAEFARQVSDHDPVLARFGFSGRGAGR